MFGMDIKIDIQKNQLKQSITLTDFENLIQR